VCVRARERELLVSCIIFIYLKILVCFIKQACLQHVRARAMRYMPMHIAELKACIIFLFNKNICLSHKTCNHFQIWGGVDNSILWLSFSQQKIVSIFISLFSFRECARETKMQNRSSKKSQHFFRLALTA
jgi:hypothetical protein